MKEQRKHSLNITIKTALLGAVAFVLMLLEFVVPFTPTFLKLDISELPVLIAGFALGPISAIGVEFIKVVMNLLFNGTITGGVGELANFLVGICFVVPAAMVYRRKKDIKHAILGMILGTFSMTLFASVFNYLILLPLYAKLMPLDVIIQAGSSVNGLIHDYNSLVLFGIAPFNFLKGILISLITLPVYKRISPILHKGL